ncbi:tyrosine-protein phosphatase [Uliginosibacterium sp. 31-16]|uniref:tyrosine-protein phosphatase n=1 Tax=Uliginosibacterium sp. 31-16 TaxID=3068315 RepID=UPI00273F1875|nr:tyrosine-protein phosphatase [Uliginosibacterium sp. 31-16]MDP5240096.1 tyrosine-protein phosphatase [Uliginosibacterium sp. 31-16]
MAHDVSSFSGRLLAYLDMLLVDHGLFRVIYNNLYALPGGLYRSSQPSPGQIRKYQRKLGIKTIINLRGADDTRRYALEAEECRRLGITLVDFKGILSRSAPELVHVQRAREMFDSIEYPALIHCKSGADRAGFAAALYRLFRLNEPVQEALCELSWKYGHLKGSKTGILDYFFEEYLAANAREPIEFMTWLSTVYNRDQLKQAFHTRGWADFLVDKVLHRE